jgi:hypothetical protein
VDLQDVTVAVSSRARLLRSGDDAEVLFCHPVVVGFVFRLALAGVFYLPVEALTVYQATWAAFEGIGLTRERRRKHQAGPFWVDEVLVLLIPDVLLSGH